MRVDSALADALRSKERSIREQPGLRYTNVCSLHIGRSRGHARRTPPYGTQFFCFRIHFHQKVVMSDIDAPITGRRPLREILDPPLLHN